MVSRIGVQPSVSYERVVATAWRLLCLRADRDELTRMGERHLLFGLLCAWSVGVGRYWHMADVHPLHQLGVVAVLYAFALAALLYLLVRPLDANGAGYGEFVTLVTLSASPALLFAFPYERYFEARQTAAIEGGLLVAVSLWRIGILVYFLRVVSRLGWGEIVVVLSLVTALIGAGLGWADLGDHAARALRGADVSGFATTDWLVRLVRRPAAVWAAVLALPAIAYLFLLGRRDTRAPVRRPPVLAPMAASSPVTTLPVLSARRQEAELGPARGEGSAATVVRRLRTALQALAAAGEEVPPHLGFELHDLEQHMERGSPGPEDRGYSARMLRDVLAEHPAFAAGELGRRVAKLCDDLESDWTAG